MIKKAKKTNPESVTEKDLSNTAGGTRKKKSDDDVVTTTTITDSFNTTNVFNGGGFPNGGVVTNGSLEAKLSGTGAVIDRGTASVLSDLVHGGGPVGGAGTGVNVNVGNADPKARFR